MSNLFLKPHFRAVRACLSGLGCAAAALLMLSSSTLAQTPLQGVNSALQAHDRISAEALGSAPVVVPHTASERVKSAALIGHLPGATQIHGMSLVITPSADQQAAMRALAVEQTDPSSPLYHQWLTPEQFGARFGLTDADLTAVEGWLTSRGFTVDEVAPGRNRISFSGTSAQVEQAFGTTMQRYTDGTQEFYSNSTDVALPQGLVGVVGAIGNLSSYRLRPHAVKPRPVQASGALQSAGGGSVPQYTDGKGNHFLTPWDFRQIYDLNSLVSNGFDGTGVKVAVAGQSQIDTTQIGYFQTLTGQSQKSPVTVLEPNTGVSTAVSGDEGESELDVEYAGGTAPGDTVEFVYTGNSPNYGVLDAAVYAIQKDIAPIVSISYGGCEVGDGPYATQVLEPFLLQANVQGQTVLAASGDSDSAECDADQGTGSSAGVFTTAQLGLTVSYPASSPNITAVGGTELTSNASQYWSATNNNFGGSASGYIPEAVWNETAQFGGNVTGGGGGASGLFSKPSWQVSPGVPADGHRDVPDVSFNSSAAQFPYVYCSAELNSSGKQTEACTSTKLSVAAGGTSFATPNFAAMLAIVEQQTKSNGLGNINPSLYAIGNGASYGVVFHDVTQGNNQEPCTIGTEDCTTGTMGYVAGTGYDQASGLGSIDGAAFATALPTVVVKTSNVPTVSLYSNPTTAAVGTPFTITASVSGAGTAATGSVTFAVDGGTPSAPATLTNGAATYTVSSFSTAGTHTVTAVYSGDSNYASVTTTLRIQVSTPVSGAFSMSSTPATQTVAAGNSAPVTITLTSNGGFADTVQFTASVNPQPSTSQTLCYSLANATVAAGGTATANFTLYTSASACTQAGQKGAKTFAPTVQAFLHQPPSNTSRGPGLPFRPLVPAIAAAGLLCFSLRKRRGMVPVLTVVLLSFAALGMSGCGSGGTVPGSGGTGTGTGGSGTSGSGTTYTVTVTGTSASNSKISASTSFNVVITQ